MSRFLPFLILILMAACTRNEVRLDFELTADVNEPCRLLYYASGKNGGTIRETVAEIHGGKGEIVLPTVYPSLIYLFSPSRKAPAIIMYASRGDKMVIRGGSGNVDDWEVAGNRVTEALSSWRKENATLIRDRDLNPQKLNEAVASYVKEHPDSPAAAIILYFYFLRRGHEREFYDLQSKLAKSVTSDEELMGALSMGDLISSLPDSPKLPERLVLTGESGYADTLPLSKGPATLLLFRASSGDFIPADTLKALLRKSRTKKVAEIYMDMDSLGWRRSFRNDTVNGLARLWMPLGLADTMAIKMGVRRMPYYIVVDSKGKEAYRGDDWETAIGKFDSLSP